MELFFAGVFAGLTALVWWELALFALVFLVIVFGSAFDRDNDRLGLKWVGFVMMLALIGLFTPSTAAVGLLSWATAQAVGAYLLAGLVYTMVVEIPSGVLRRRRKLSAHWETSDAKKLVTKAATTGKAEDQANAVAGIERFVAYVNDSGALVNLSVKPDTLELDPSLNRAHVLYSTTPWLLMWPAYALSLIFGDLLTNIAEFIFDTFQNLGNRMVRKLFANTFKV